MLSASAIRRLFRQNISSLVLAAVVLPIHDRTAWQEETYSRIPTNKTVQSDAGLLVKVAASSSPLVHAFKAQIKVKSFRIQGKFLGLPKFKDPGVQGEKGFDDYVLRLGFVVPGDKKMSRMQRLFAPAWIKHLYELAPKGTGIDHIEFFNVTQNPKQVGKMRRHPLSDLITESYFALATGPGDFDLSYTPAKPVDAAAVWLSIDGDDTKSTYDVMITKIELETP